MSADLDSERIRKAFEALAEQMLKQRITARLYLIGGAAIALCHRRDRTTADIDVLVEEETGSVMQAAAAISSKLGLPRNWLNDDVRNVPVMPPPRDLTARVVCAYPNLVVTAASPTHLLAMKAHACRDKDIDDIRALCDNLSIQSPHGICDIHDGVFPDDPIPVEAKRRLETIDLRPETVEQNRWKLPPAP